MPLPVEVAHVWGYYGDLAGTRTHGPGGLHPISYTEIDAYARRMRLDITPFETWLIREIDAVVLRKMHAKPAMPGLRDEVSIDDGAGVKQLMRRLGKKKPPKAVNAKEGGRNG